MNHSVLDDGVARQMFLWLMALRIFGVLALAWVGWLAWRRGFRNLDQLTARPGDLLFFFIHGVHLVFHEAGHWIFAPFGEFMRVFGGSLNQVLIPAICTGTFYWQHRYASGAFTLFWVGQALTDVAVYAADGRDRMLPLLGDSGSTFHDWGRILAWWRMVDQAETVGRRIFGVGMMVIFVSLLLLALEILRLWQNPMMAARLELDD